MPTDLIPDWVVGVFLIAFGFAFLVSAIRWLAARRDLQSQLVFLGLQLLMLRDLLRQYHDELLSEAPHSSARVIRIAKLRRKIFRQAGITEEGNGGG